MPITSEMLRKVRNMVAFGVLCALCACCLIVPAADPPLAVIVDMSTRHVLVAPGDMWMNGSESTYLTLD